MKSTLSIRSSSRPLLVCEVSDDGDTRAGGGSAGHPGHSPTWRNTVTGRPHQASGTSRKSAQTDPIRIEIP